MNDTEEKSSGDSRLKFVLVGDGAAGKVRCTLVIILMLNKLKQFDTNNLFHLPVLTMV